MKTFEAQVRDDMSKNEVNREKVRSEVAAALAAAGIEAQIDLTSQSVTGLLMVSSDASPKDVLEIVRSCNGIQSVGEADSQALHSQAVLDEPPPDA